MRRGAEPFLSYSSASQPRCVSSPLYTSTLSLYSLMTPRQRRGSAIGLSLPLLSRRIRGMRTYRPHWCPQCDGGIDLKVHSCFHNAVSVPTFKLAPARPGDRPPPPQPPAPRATPGVAATTLPSAPTTDPTTNLSDRFLRLFPPPRPRPRPRPDLSVSSSRSRSLLARSRVLLLSFTPSASASQPPPTPPLHPLSLFVSLSFSLFLFLLPCIGAIKSPPDDSADG